MKLIELLVETLPELPKYDYHSVDERVVEILANGKPVCQVAVFSAEVVDEMQRLYIEDIGKLKEEEKNKPWYRKIYDFFR